MIWITDCFFYLFAVKHQWYTKIRFNFLIKKRRWNYFSFATITSFVFLPLPSWSVYELLGHFCVDSSSEISLQGYCHNSLLPQVYLALAINFDLQTSAADRRQFSGDRIVECLLSAFSRGLRYYRRRSGANSKRGMGTEVIGGTGGFRRIRMFPERWVTYEGLRPIPRWRYYIGTPCFQRTVNGY